MCKKLYARPKLLVLTADGIIVCKTSQIKGGNAKRCPLFTQYEAGPVGYSGCTMLPEHYLVPSRTNGKMVVHAPYRCPLRGAMEGK